LVRFFDRRGSVDFIWMGMAMFERFGSGGFYVNLLVNSWFLYSDKNLQKLINYLFLREVTKTESFSSE
jgi:hypothetical protein